MGQELARCILSQIKKQILLLIRLAQQNVDGVLTGDSGYDVTHSQVNQDFNEEPSIRSSRIDSQAEGESGFQIEKQDYSSIWTDNTTPTPDVSCPQCHLLNPTCHKSTRRPEMYIEDSYCCKSSFMRKPSKLVTHKSDACIEESTQHVRKVPHCEGMNSDLTTPINDKMKVTNCIEEVGHCESSVPSSISHQKQRCEAKKHDISAGSTVSSHHILNYVEHNYSKDATIHGKHKHLEEVVEKVSKKFRYLHDNDQSDLQESAQEMTRKKGRTEEVTIKNLATDMGQPLKNLSTLDEMNSDFRLQSVAQVNQCMNQILTTSADKEKAANLVETELLVNAPIREGSPEFEMVSSDKRQTIDYICNKLCNEADESVTAIIRSAADKVLHDIFSQEDDNEESTGYREEKATDLAGHMSELRGIRQTEKSQNISPFVAEQRSFSEVESELHLQSLAQGHQNTVPIFTAPADEQRPADLVECFVSTSGRENIGGNTGFEMVSRDKRQTIDYICNKLCNEADESVTAIIRSAADKVLHDIFSQEDNNEETSSSSSSDSEETTVPKCNLGSGDDISSELFYHETTQSPLWEANRVKGLIALSGRKEAESLSTSSPMVITPLEVVDVGMSKSLSTGRQSCTKRPFSNSNGTKNPHNHSYMDNSQWKDNLIIEKKPIMFSKVVSGYNGTVEFDDDAMKAVSRKLDFNEDTKSKDGIILRRIEEDMEGDSEDVRASVDNGLHIDSVSLDTDNKVIQHFPNSSEPLYDSTAIEGDSVSSRRGPYSALRPEVVSDSLTSNMCQEPTNRLCSKTEECSLSISKTHQHHLELAGISEETPLLLRDKLPVKKTQHDPIFDQSENSMKAANQYVQQVMKSSVVAHAVNDSSSSPNDHRRQQSSKNKYSFKQPTCDYPSYWPTCPTHDCHYQGWQHRPWDNTASFNSRPQYIHRVQQYSTNTMYNNWSQHNTRPPWMGTGFLPRQRFREYHHQRTMLDQTAFQEVHGQFCPPMGNWYPGSHQHLSPWPQVNTRWNSVVQQSSEEPGLTGSVMCNNDTREQIVGPFYYSCDQTSSTESQGNPPFP